MSRLNWIFTFSSLSVVLVTIERFSFTAKIFLNPYHFLRLHELFQMVFVILLTVILPFFLFKEVTNNFTVGKIKHGTVLLTLFVTGVYFYATGNGVHEVSSFNFNFFCNVKHIQGTMCNGFFFNDYYTGNILYFFGGFLMVASLLLTEKQNQNNTFTKKEFYISLVNAIIYSLALFAYAAFDKVSVGIIYTIITCLFSIALFIPIRRRYLTYPVITYTTITYTLGALLSILFRLKM